MNREWQHIPISQYNTFDRLSAEEIKKLSVQYPYSSFYQLLLTLKQKENDEPAFKKQAGKTALYLNNIPWLSFVLNEAAAGAVLPEAENINTAEPLTDEMIDEVVAETEREQEVGHEQEIATDSKQVSDLINGDEKKAATESEINQQAERNYSLVSNYPESIDTVAEQTDEQNEPEAGSDHSLVSSILDREKEMANQETELKIEPLYTVDYFASQGIKHITEQVPADKFGKQLRSFTEWLKTMKRLPTEESAEINETDEKKIKADAEDSNETKEVLTEAMAEVLVKQGKTHKAIEIFQKLSLQHPGKSPYFAALIEQLKK